MRCTHSNGEHLEYEWVTTGEPMRTVVSCNGPCYRKRPFTEKDAIKFCSECAFIWPLLETLCREHWEMFK